MPTLITRDQALQRIRDEGGEPACLMCAIASREVGELWTIHEDDEALVMLPRYVRRWGHVMVMPRAHVTSFSGVDPALWARCNLLAHQAARMVEAVMQPRRCYVASTGSSAGELTQSSRHLHIHVIPLYEADDRPSDIFSWQAGVYVGEPAEWAELQRRYRAAWPGAASPARP
ncbi:MAG: HIT family protein [Myxococcales bacterium]|nr:HIT family protein [Myxococcales bacterium]